MPALRGVRQLTIKISYMIRQPAGKRSGIIVLWPDTGRRMRTVRSAFGQRSRIMRQIEREELNMDPVDADFAKWEIGITALFLIFMIITDNIDFSSFFRSDDSINQNAIREKLRKSRRPFVGSGGPAAPQTTGKLSLPARSPPRPATSRRTRTCPRISCTP